MGMGEPGMGEPGMGEVGRIGGMGVEPEMRGTGVEPSKILAAGGGGSLYTKMFNNNIGEV